MFLKKVYNNIKLKNSILILIVFLTSCQSQWNNPYPKDDPNIKSLYTGFSSRPRYLDPAKSYSSDEWLFIQSIYETPLQYHYLKRPYTLEPNILTKMPTKRIDNNGNTIYKLNIKKGVYYQPHPAFVEENLTLSNKELSNINTINDFKKIATRELTAQDFIYQIKRLANPKLHSPIYSLMAKTILGLKEYRKKITNIAKKNKNKFIDLDSENISGVKYIDKYTYEITIKGINPQFLYWLATPFFTAIPKEADYFYNQQGLIKKNIVLDWSPIGTGPFMLTVNNPNKEMIMVKNPNFRDEYYPNKGNLQDKKSGLLKDSNKKIPFLDKIYFKLEKESIPYWQKFLQGYYDRSGISSDNFDQVIDVDDKGFLKLSKNMLNRNIYMLTSKSTSIYYIGFNMLDDIVGGYNIKKQKLRQAINIAINTEEFISIFANGRAEVAHSPIPSGIFGNTGKYNNTTHKKEGNVVIRKSIDKAKLLLEQAGYKNGIDPKTNKPLVLFFDTTATGPESQARLQWLRKQFSKLNINIIFRATNYNRYQEKFKKANIQIFEYGWNADYPDPENFLFLFYGGNQKLKYGGANYTNYDNSKFNKLFNKVKNMLNTDKRLEIIEKMVAIWQKDSPLVFIYTPTGFGLYHSWLKNIKPNQMTKNVLKYYDIDTKTRNIYKQKYNKIAIIPLGIFILFLCFIFYKLLRRNEN